MATAGHDDAAAPLIPAHALGPVEYGVYGAIRDAAPGSLGSRGSTESDVPDGVKRIEAVSRAWSKSGLVVAYLRFGHSNSGHGQSTSCGC